MMDRREKQELDRWITREQPEGAECGNCEGTGSFLVTLTDEPSDPETGGARRSVECPVCGGTGHAPIVTKVDPPQPDPCPACDWVGTHEPGCRLGDVTEKCAECGTPLDWADQDEEGLGGWAWIVEYGDEAYHHACIGAVRRADEKKSHAAVEAWENDPAAQADEQAARTAGGDITPPDL